jgi:hypothetical protein
MLEKCLVGRLISKTNAKGTASSLTIGATLPQRLRFDFRQIDEKYLRLFIYTTCTTLTDEHVFVHLDNSNILTVLISIDEFVHCIAIGTAIEYGFSFSFYEHEFDVYC